MPKQKTRKSIEKRIKVTSSGKLLKRHQFGAGHHKSKKTKSALNRAKRTSSVVPTEARILKKGLNL